jgi:DNA-binding HxlR family transcriptional regulator
VVNWQVLMGWLAPLRRRWDLAVLANLAAGIERPGDLIEAINAQATDGRRIGWKVLTDTLRWLEARGYVIRQEIPGVPRETRYWLREPGRQLVRAVALLDAWYGSQGPGSPGPARCPGERRPGDADGGSGPAGVPGPVGG